MEDGRVVGTFWTFAGGIIDYHAASSDCRQHARREKQPLQAAIHSLLEAAARSGTIHTNFEHSDRHRCVHCGASIARPRPNCEDSARTGEGALTDWRKLDRTRASRNMSGATKTRRKIASHVATFRCTAAQLRGVQRLRATALVLVDG